MKILVSSLLLSFLVSCSSYSEAPAPAARGSVGIEKTSQRQIQKSGSMSMKSRALKETSEKSVALVHHHRGTLASSSLTEDDYQATIKVPASSLETLMDSLQEIGTVTHRRIKADDVTEAYLDLQATLKNKRALRDRLRKLLAQATKVKDVLKIEEQLTRVQTELDQMEARMKSMRSRVAHSTLELSIERQRIPGPVGIVTKSTGWVFGKLVNLN